MREVKLPPDAGPLQRNIYNRMRAARLNAKSLSEKAGLGETAVRDIIVGRSKRPSHRQVEMIAAALDCNVDVLSGQPSEAPVPFLGGEAAPAAARPRTMDRRNDTIPIRSAGRGGDEQQMYSESPLGHVARPASLAGVRDAYCVYMVGESMLPRYEPGWLLYVNPLVPVRRGRAVVVIKKDQSVLIKIFDRSNDAEVILRQLNPELEIKLPRDSVADVHVITGSDENPVLATRVG